MYYIKLYWYWNIGKDVQTRRYSVCPTNIVNSTHLFFTLTFKNQELSDNELLQTYLYANIIVETSQIHVSE